MVSKWKKSRGEKSRRALKNKVSALEYLALVSIKYEVDPDELLYALNLAWKQEEATCRQLSIQCRGRKQDEAVFLILDGSAVVAQFPIPHDFLFERDNPIRDFMKTDIIHKHLNKKNNEPHTLSIRDLRTGMTHVNVKAKVLQIPRPKFVVTRYGNCASVTNALIADETGTIKLCLWNSQITSISNGDTIQIENARTYTFKGEKQLSIGRNGTLSNLGDIHSQLEQVHSV
jgi:replication factor A1